MTLTPTVGLGQIITPEWGNEIRNRTNQVFATTTERDVAFPTPDVGQTCYVTAAKAEFTWDGTRWVGSHRAVGRAVSLLGATYDPTKPVWTVHSRAAVTSDASGNGTIDLTAAGITGVTGILNVQLQGIIFAGSGYFPQLAWVVTSSTLTSLAIRMFTVTGTPSGAGVVQITFAVTYQGNPPT
jgi:hypothetical protein